MKKISAVSFLIILMSALSIRIAAQEIDITPALQKIESGRIKLAEQLLREFKSQNPDDPSVLFLDAVLTKDGNQALNKYLSIIDKYPKNKYADAALYRIFSYYYSLGYYKKAESYSAKLKKDYPDSPYLKTAGRPIPNEDAAESPEENVSPARQKDTTYSQTNHAADTAAYNFTIQAGAFLNVENANNLCARLKEENYSAEISTREIGGSVLNVVSVGKFEKEEDANPVLSLIEKKFGLKGRIVKLVK